MRVESGAPPQAVLQAAQHVLFVEGAPAGLDVQVLENLVPTSLRVSPLGASYSVRSVATALRAYHPSYWFIIDRDDWDDATVEGSWDTFPDPAMDNLLIWRRKELESYFLEPEWVCNSPYIKNGAGADALRTWLSAEASKSLLLESANRVLVRIRHSVKKCAAPLIAMSDVEGKTRDEVARVLVDAAMITELRRSVTAELDEGKVRDAYSRECTELSGGRDELEWGIGRWRDLMSAKSMFRSMVNQWFRVPDHSKGGNARLTGREAERAVATDLLRNHQDSMPSDFSRLRDILVRVTGGAAVTSGGLPAASAGP